MQCEACGHENVDGARFCASCGVTLDHPTDDSDPRVGEKVGGRYLITGIIGEGGMGKVYEAEQQMGTAVRKVAVKTLHAELSHDTSVMARFHRECGTVAQLEHPNTIKVYDFGTMDDGTLYIAMEYLAGEPLDKVIEESAPMKPARVKKLLRQIAGSLDEAHRQGIVHRDLKPENVILIERAGEKDVVKLLDFGIAARTESADAEKEAKLTQQGMVLGTPPYMSPEQFTGKALDRRSDIYSMAVMTYEMLTGKLPFDANTPWEWATQHMTVQPRPFETMEVSGSIPREMRSAILKALEKDRDDRFDTVIEFVDALDSGVVDPNRSVVPGLDASGVDPSMATAAMAAAPDFTGGGAGAPAPTAVMPAQAASSATSGPAIAVPPPPATGRATNSGGGKGLLYGLGGAAALLLGGLAYALSQGGDSGAADDTGVIDITQTDEPPAGTIAPVPTAEDTQTDDSAPADDESETDDVSDDSTSAAPGPKPSPSPAPGPKPSPSPSPAPGPKPSPAPSPAPAPTAAPPSGGDAACNDCIKKAGQGNITGAATSFRQCSDAGKKSACSARARQRAPAAASKAQRAGKCDKVGRIKAAAVSMNASSAALDAVVQRCASQ
jgi:serine/threonine-protein kinase